MSIDDATPEEWDKVTRKLREDKEYGDDVQQAVLAGIEMIESLDKFNEIQRSLGTKEFKIGIGILFVIFETNSLKYGII